MNVINHSEQFLHLHTYLGLFYLRVFSRASEHQMNNSTQQIRYILPFCIILINPVILMVGMRRNH